MRNLLVLSLVVFASGCKCDPNDVIIGGRTDGGSTGGGAAGGGTGGGGGVTFTGTLCIAFRDVLLDLVVG